MTGLPVAVAQPFLPHKIVCRYIFRLRVFKIGTPEKSNHKVPPEVP